MVTINQKNQNRSFTCKTVVDADVVVVMVSRLYLRVDESKRYGSGGTNWTLWELSRGRLCGGTGNHGIEVDVMRPSFL